MPLPKRYTKTVAYMTRFRAKREAGEPINFIFSNRDEDAPVAPLSAADVFEKLKPELRLDGQKVYKIGQRSFLGVMLKQPTETPQGGELLIGLDSMLLDQVTGQAATHMEVGGKLFRQLIEDLDVVTQFSGPKFVRVLLDAARLYLPEHVDRDRGESSPQIGTHQTGELLEKPLIADAVLRVLQAPEADVPRAKNALEAALRDVSIEAHSDTDKSDMRKRFVDGLMDLRNKVLLGSHFDTTIEKILGIHPKDKVAQEEHEWFRNFSKHRDAFNLRDSGTLQPGSSFSDYYKYYMNHAENVHRFARAPVMHSFVFMWLISKYKSYPLTNFRNAAQEVFKLGVQRAVDRNFGESDSDRADRKSSVTDAGEKRIEDFELGMKDGTDLTEAQIALKKRMARQMLEAATDVFNAETTFSRRQLQDLLEGYFADAAASTGGELAKVLTDSREFISKYRNIYTRLLGILNPPQSFANPRQMIQKIEKLGADDYKTDLQSVAKQAQASIKKNEPRDATTDAKAAVDYRRRVRNDVMNMFAKKVGETSIQKFGDRFDKKAGEIEREIEELKQAYRVDREINDALHKVESMAAGANMPSAIASDGNRELTKDSVEPVVNKIIGMNPSTERVFPNPNSDDLINKLKDPESDLLEGKLCIGRNNIGSVKVTHAGVHVEIDAPKFKKAKLNQSVKLIMKDSKEITIDKLDPEGNIRSFITDTARDRPLSKEEIEAQVKKLPNGYGACLEKMQTLYCGEGDLSAAARDDFERAMRALGFGGFVQVAPDAESRIGVTDISQTMRLMLDLVRNVGNLQYQEQAEACPDKETSGALKRLNLSTYFPVPDEDRGASIQFAMDYHRTVCDSVMKIADHLADINDLKAIASALPDDAKLVVVNSTVQEYIQNINKFKNFLQASHHPSVILLGRCAVSNKDNWTPLLDLLKTRFQNANQTVTLSCPMVVSHSRVDQSCPFPVAQFDPGFSKINFAHKPLDCGRQTGDDDIVLAVNRGRALVPLSIFAGIAMAPLLEDSVLGKFVTMDDFHIQINVGNNAGATFQPGEEGEYVVEFLRRCWLESEKNTALEAFVTARLATLAFQYRSQNAVPYAEFHKAMIQTQDPHPVLTDVIKFLGLQDDKSSSLNFINGNGNTPLDQGKTVNDRFFNGNNVILLQIDGVDKALEQKRLDIPAGMRQGLGFVGI